MKYPILFAAILGRAANGVRVGVRRANVNLLAP